MSSRFPALATMVDDAPFRLTGYHIIQAAAGRKQAFLAASVFRLTMIFATDVRTVEEAEEQFTSEAHMLLTGSGSDWGVWNDVLGGKPHVIDWSTR